MVTKLILLTNDDGFFSEGIRALKTKFQKMGDVYIVAPDMERSATSMALTLHHPIRIRKVDERTYGVSGTPCDCVYMALQHLLPREPDLLVSGINPGPNLGQQDVAYSGTVAGAFQGGFLKIPSLAVSLLPDREGNYFFDLTAEIAFNIAEKWLKNRPESNLILNINVPPPPIKGIKLTRLGQKRYNPEIIAKKDPRNRDYYWVGTGTPKPIGEADSDVRVIEDGFISITPLQKDTTDFLSLKEMDQKKSLGNIDHEVLS